MDWLYKHAYIVIGQICWEKEFFNVAKKSGKGTDGRTEIWVINIVAKFIKISKSCTE